MLLSISQVNGGMVVAVGGDVGLGVGSVVAVAVGFGLSTTITITASVFALRASVFAKATTDKMAE